MTSVSIPSFTGGQVERYTEDPITFAVKTGQTVRGGRFVEATASMECQEAGSVSIKVLGLALHDADPAGSVGKVAVATEGVYNCVASGAISAGDQVYCDTGGRVKTIPAVNVASLATEAQNQTDYRGCVGIAIEDIVDTALGPIQLRLGA